MVLIWAVVVQAMSHQGYSLNRRSAAPFLRKQTTSDIAWTGSQGPSRRIKHISALVSAGASSNLSRQAEASTQRLWDLRLCNAYAYEGWVHVFHSFGRRSGMSYTAEGASGEKCLTSSSGPLPFKRCTDVSGIDLGVGSLLQFRIAGDMDIGTFSVDHLPDHGSMLLLALKRRDTWSTAADFASHVFADIPGSQVALIDAYLGRAKSDLEVRDVRTGFDNLQETPHREEKVQFGTVVDIAPGSYEWHLMDSTVPRNLAEKASVEFKAVSGVIYTVLRVGADAVGGQSFPEELIVWPQDGAVIQRGPGGAGGKGLFGIPSDLYKPARRSLAMGRMLSWLTLSVAVCTVISGVD